MPQAYEPLPIVIGAAGHRNIPPEHFSALEAEVEAALTQLRALYPDSPIELMTSLADGADRLCARAALKLGMALIAALPMSEDAYRQDFSGDSALEFDRLLMKAREVFVAPPAEPMPENAGRGYRYRQAELSIANRAHLLLALWDGRETLFPEGGGTYETILFAREKRVSVVHIAVPRPGDPFVSSDQNVPLSEALSAIDGFNRNAKRHGDTFSSKAEQAKRCLVDEETEARLAPAQRRLMDAHLALDQLSLINRNLRLRAIRTLSLLGLALVIAFLLYDEMESTLMLPLYAAALAAAVGVYAWSKRANLNQNYITYRMMAEALRVQFYWSLSGIGTDVYECLTFTQKRELRFVDALLRSLGRGGPESGAPGASTCAVAHWVRGQLHYHVASERNKSGKQRLNARAASAALAASVMLFFVIWALETWGEPILQWALPPGAWMHAGQAVTLRTALKILLGTVSAGTAFLANYYGSLALAEQIFDNCRMSELYREAASLLENGAQPRAVLTMLGRESINESANWYLAQRENAPQLFIG